MASNISVALAGIGGYGHLYLSALLDAKGEQGFRIAGAVDPFPEKSSRLADIKARGIPIYASLEEFYAAAQADLAVIASPIHLHCAQTCLALSQGSHVLCEKPLGATFEQARRMKAARDRAGKVAAIGYQWSFAPATQALKRDIAAGAFGRPLRLRTLVLWPRDEKYYRRSRWAGARQDDKGNWILDSPVNNAASHYLHHALYVLGAQTDRSAWPLSVTAELYRAHPITNYDTAILRSRLENGAELLFAATHACRQRRGPIISYDFEKATVSYDYDAGRLFQARFKDGSVKDYGSPDADTVRKLWETMEAARGGKPVVCGIEAAAAQTACMYAAQQSPPDIATFPSSLIQVEGEPGARKTWVQDLEAVLTRCCEEFKLPGELGVAWARPGREADTREYRL